MKTLLFILLQAIIVGDIADVATGEPIANASVYYANTKDGTTSDNEGSFYLKADFERKRTLVVSAIGYHSERFVIEPNQMAGIDVRLREKTSQLQELLVTPGANPALAMIDSLRAHRIDYDQNPNITYEHVTELGLSEFTPQQLKRHLWKQIEPYLVDSFLPLYRCEETVGYRDQWERIGPKKEEAFILTATDYEVLLADNSHLNFYHNEIPLIGKAFLSPLASAGKTYYNYYLVDSSEVAGGKTYTLDFKTKNPFYATFNGRMVVDSGTWAIRSIEAKIPRQSSVNYLVGGSIRQAFDGQQNLKEEDVTALLDFSIKGDSSHVWPSAMLRQSLSSVKLKVDSLKKPSSLEVDSLTAQRSNSESGRSAERSFSPQGDPMIQFATWLARIISTGYIPTGTAIDFGHVQEILQVNKIEGVHVGIPLRTNERLWKNVSLEAAVGYGFKDRQFKGLGKISFNLPTLRRNIIKVEYRDQYVWEEVDDFTSLMRENGVGYGTMDFTAYAFEALYSNKNATSSMIRKRQFQIATENDWSDVCETNLYFRLGDIRPPSAERPLTLKDRYAEGVSYGALGGIVRLGWGERKVDSYFRRVHVGGRYPTVFVGAELGGVSPYPTSPERGGVSYDLYGKLTLMVKQTVSLGLGGNLDYVAQVGTTIGQVPFTLLHHFEGNQGYAYDPYRFTLMNNLQYNAKHFCALHLSWNGQGVLFNLIPGIQYLRLRELVTFKLAANLDPASYRDETNPFREPYVEVGCGIGNILRVLDLHSVWRVTNRQDPTTPRWAMRFRIHLDL